jgi:Helix-turn-helix domain
MARPAKAPELTQEEWGYLEHLSRASSAPAAPVIRAKLLTRVAEGTGYSAAARAVGRRSGDAVAHRVRRFNPEGLEALEPRHGGGPGVVYGEAERAGSIAEVTRTPDREQDGTATWSLSTLQQALRRAADGLPRVSQETILKARRAAGWSWQQGRSWGETGKVLRQRKAGVVEVTDPDTVPKKT